MNLQKLEFAVTDVAYGKLFIRNLPKYHKEGKILILTRLLYTGTDIFGRKIYSKAKERHGVYSKNYGKYKERRGGVIHTYNLKLTGLFYKGSFFDKTFTFLIPPSQRRFMMTSKYYPYMDMARLSEDEKNVILQLYAKEAFAYIEKAFKGVAA